MNDNDIRKGIECCLFAYGKKCEECPYEKYKPFLSSIQVCTYSLKKDILDLFNRQKAEIEELQKEVMIQICKIEEERQKAVKEFAERLKQKSEADSLIDKIGNVKILLNIDVNDIDNLVKEMVGEKE